MVSPFNNNCFIHVGVEVPVEVEMTSNSSMSEEDFFKWLRSRGVSDKDCKTLSGKMHQHYCIL